MIGAGDRADLADRLLPLLADERWWVRTAAKESLADIGGEVVPIVRRALAHDDRFARNGAAEVLHELGVVDMLVRRIELDPRDEMAEADLAKIFAAGGDAVVRTALVRAPAGVRARLEQIAADAPRSHTA